MEFPFFGHKTDSQTVEKPATQAVGQAQEPLTGEDLTQAYDDKSEAFVAPLESEAAKNMSGTAVINAEPASDAPASEAQPAAPVSELPASEAPVVDSENQTPASVA